MLFARLGDRGGRRRVRLAAILAVLLAPLGARFAVAAVPVSASVDVGNGIRTVGDNGLALHTSVYANQFGNSSLDDRLIEAGVELLRYPGGSYSDNFHWSIPPQLPYYRNHDGTANPPLPDVTQPHPLSPDKGANPTVNNPWPYGYHASASDFPGFLNLLQNSLTQAMITVNYGSSLGNLDGSNVWRSTKGGQPQEAAAWVAYANADPSIYGTANDVDLGADVEGVDWKTAGYWARLRTSTLAEYQIWAQADGVYNPANNFLAVNRDAAVGIQYWEIGNEINGNGFYGGTGWENDLHEPYDGTRAGDVDLAPQTYGANLVQFAALMKQVDPTIQIGAVMVGNAPGAVGNTGNPNTNWDRRMLLAAGDAQVTVNGQSYNALDFGILHWYVDNDPTSTSGNCTIGTAACETNFLNATPQLVGIYQELRNRVDLYTNRDPNTFPIHMTEFGYFDSVGNSSVATGLFAADVYGTALELGAESVHFLEMSSLFLSDSGSLTRQPAFRAFQMLDRFFDPGDEFIDTGSDSSNLKVYAVRQSDGTVAIMMINLLDGSANDADVTLNINGPTLSDEGARWLWGNGVSGDPSQLAVSGLGNSFTITVPDRTVMVLLIPEAPMLDGDFNGDNVVDAADYTTWRDGLGTTFTPADYDVWKANFGATAPGGGSAGVSSSHSAVPEPSAPALVLAGMSAAVCTFRSARRQRRA